jgi:hypothetical protein
VHLGLDYVPGGSATPRDVSIEITLGISRFFLKCAWLRDLYLIQYGLGILYWNNGYVYSVHTEIRTQRNDGLRSDVI